MHERLELDTSKYFFRVLLPYILLWEVTTCSEEDYMLLAMLQVVSMQARMYQASLSDLASNSSLKFLRL